jgi:glucose/arabinose dehydrogenase
VPPMECRNLLVASLLLAAAAPAPAQTLNDSRLRLETWVSGLKRPTLFCWVGARELLVFEKDTGKVRRVKNGNLKNVALDLSVAYDSERGGLGIAADPDFAHNSYVYLYYSLTSGSGDTVGSWAENRVERYTFDGTNLVNPSGPLISFAMDPAQAGNGPNHDGGVIAFGPDGKLYGATGDLNRGRFGGQERIEQNTAVSGSAFVGGMFRINSDGTIPGDNPFIAESDSNLHKWFSYGLRNCFGMAFDPLTGLLWYTENGPDKYDEINRCPPGMNSGWLKIMGPDSRDATYGENGNTAYDQSQLTILNNSVYVDPEFSFKTPVGITAIQFIHSKRFPTDLRDNVFVGDNNTGNLYYFVMKKNRQEFRLRNGVADKVADNSNEVNSVVGGTGFSVITDIQVGADGYLYLTNLNSGNIQRIRPVVDLVEATALDVVSGRQRAGTLEDLEESDDAWMQLTADGSSKLADEVQIGLTYVLNEVQPTSVTIDVETHASGPAQERLLARNQVTGAWDALEVRDAATQDVLRTLTLANAADYIRAGDKTIELSYVARALDGNGQPGLSGGSTTNSSTGTVRGPGSGRTPPSLRVYLDQLRLNVAYP